MATVSKWAPFGVALNLSATASSITRTSATQFTVKFNVSWSTYWDGAETNFGMKAVSGGVTKVLNAFATYSSGSSGSFTGTFSISGNGAQTKEVTVTFTNWEENWQGTVTQSATKSIKLSVEVPAWTSYKVTYNANGGTGAPGSQTKWKDQTLKLSTTKPTRTGYTFQGWATSASGGVAYAAGANYTTNAGVTLYAVWKANTWTVKYNANGGTGAPASQTKTYGQTLTLSSTKPTRTNYNFKGWGTSASATTVAYAAGASYTANAGITLYAIWELAYIKPRINSLSADRCNSEGVLSDEGTYGLIKFNWTTDWTVTSITIQWKLTSDSSWNSVTVSASGTSGSVSEVIGEGAIDTNNTYDVLVTVADGNDHTPKSVSIFGLAFPIDVLIRNKGIAFGGPATLEGFADFFWMIYTRGGFRYPVLPTGTDFNDVKTPNVYYGTNLTVSEYINCPATATATFTLEVFPAGTNGQVMQRLTECYKNEHKAYVRHYYNDSWGNWVAI